MATDRERRWWTKEEDEVLRACFKLQEERNGRAFNWNEVALSLPGRTNKDCRKRWSKIQSGINKGAWKRIEDEMLQEGVEKHGAKWTLVAKGVRTRNADQCAKRWQHVLGPGCKHGPWTTEEDRKLLAAIEKHGNNWKQIGLSELQGRSSHDIRNRSVALSRRGRDQQAAPSTRSSSKDVEETMQQRRTSYTEDEGDLEFDYECEEDYSSSIVIDEDIGAQHASTGGRADIGPRILPPGSNCSEVSHTIDIAGTGATSSINSMWGCPDFTAYPLIFDEQQLSMTPNSGNSSNCSYATDTSLSRPAHLHAGLAPFVAPPSHAMDLGDLDVRMTDTAHSSRDHDRTFDNVGVTPWWTLESSQEAPCSSTRAETKGHVSITFRQVDPKVAQEIVSSVLKYNESLVIRLQLE